MNPETMTDNELADANIRAFGGKCEDRAALRREFCRRFPRTVESNRAPFPAPTPAKLAKFLDVQYEDEPGFDL